MPDTTRTPDALLNCIDGPCYDESREETVPVLLDTSFEIGSVEPFEGDVIRCTVCGCELDYDDAMDQAAEIDARNTPPADPRDRFDS